MYNYSTIIYYSILSLLYHSPTVLMVLRNLTTYLSYIYSESLTFRFLLSCPSEDRSLRTRKWGGAIPAETTKSRGHYEQRSLLAMPSMELACPRMPAVLKYYYIYLSEKKVSKSLSFHRRRYGHSMVNQMSICLIYANDRTGQQ